MRALVVLLYNELANGELIEAKEHRSSFRTHSATMAACTSIEVLSVNLFFRWSHPALMDGNPNVCALCREPLVGSSTSLMQSSTSGSPVSPPRVTVVVHRNESCKGRYHASCFAKYRNHCGDKGECLKCREECIANDSLLVIEDALLMPSSTASTVW